MIRKNFLLTLKNRISKNAVKEENSESYEETEIPVSDESKSTKKSNGGSEMAKVRVQVSERIVHVPGYEYIEVIEKEVYECPNCVNDDETPVAARTCAAGSRKFTRRSCRLK
ncbi:MAG: hypothetical protein IKP60_11715, partial [Treponema sp.]|nr:hypothetical protein [Treponema sp.]